MRLGAEALTGIGNGGKAQSFAWQAERGADYAAFFAAPTSLRSSRNICPLSLCVR